MLEILSYHSLNEVEYINQLKKELSEQGLLEYEKKEVVKLEPSKRAKELVGKNKIYKNNVIYSVFFALKIKFFLWN